MSEHPIIAKNRRVAAAAQAAYDRAGMAEALHFAVKAAFNEVRMARKAGALIDDCTENRDMVNMLYCHGLEEVVKP